MPADRTSLAGLLSSLVTAFPALAAGGTGGPSTEPAPPGAEGTITSVYEVPFAMIPLEGSAVIATVLGPPGGASIWHTELQLGWVSTGAQPASELLVNVSAHVDGGASRTWAVTGADLGFGDGPGLFTGSASTDLLNGTADHSWFAGASVLDVEILSTTGVVWGALVDARFVFHLGPRLFASTGGLSLAAGGAQELALAAGPLVGPGQAYFVFGSASAAAPLGAVDGLPLPFALDGYTTFTLASANQGPFASTAGVLDAEGGAAAAIVLPAGTDPALAGLVLRHAFAVLDGGAGTVLGFSNAVELALAA